MKKFIIVFFIILIIVACVLGFLYFKGIISLDFQELFNSSTNLPNINNIQTNNDYKIVLSDRVIYF